MAVLLKRSFRPEKIRLRFSLDSEEFDSLPIRLDGNNFYLPMPNLYRFLPEAAEMIDAVTGTGGSADLRTLLENLAACECADRQEEIHVLLKILQALPRGKEGTDGDAFQKRILWLLRKFAHRKYRDRFERTVAELRSFAEGDPEAFSLLLNGLEEVTALARRRFEG